MTIKATALAGLESAINHYLVLDPATLERVASLSGRVIAIELKNLNVVFYLLPGSEGIQVRSMVDTVPDITLRGTPLALMRVGLAKKQQHVLFSGDVEITGDTEAGQRFKEILDSLEVDWEEQLSKIVGDIVAHKVGNVVRGIQDWSAQTMDTLSRDITDYMQEESRMLPHRSEVEEFLSEVDTLRADVDRLDFRVKRLQQFLQGDT